MAHSFLRCGIIEGFYGKPYTHSQRLDLIQFLAEQGMNEYVYAPKQDPYHRQKWQDAYPLSKLQKLYQYQQEAENAGITFCFALSPGLSIDYESNDDLEHLIAKFQPLYNVGCRDFALLLDDINLQPPDVSLAQKQIRLLMRLQEEWDDVKWRICPTEYHGTGQSDYLRALGRKLPETISIFWTGPEICSSQISTEYLKRIADVFQRPPLLWDNYPVNDASMTSQIHLHPFDGRDKDLPLVVEGLLANPMNQYEASKIPLMTIAAYCRHPQNYNPETELDNALSTMCEPGEIHPLKKFIQYSSPSCIEPNPGQSLFALISQVLSSFESQNETRETYLQQLLKICQEMQDIAKVIIDLKNTALRRDLWRWAQRLEKWGDFGEDSVRKILWGQTITEWDDFITYKTEIRTLKVEFLRMLTHRDCIMAPDTLFEAAWQGIYQRVKREL